MKIRKGYIKYTVNFILSLTVIFIALIIWYCIIVNQNNMQYLNEYKSNDFVSLRKFPYPYQAAMAISSDIDNTYSNNEFLTIQKFLNTQDETELGKGIGLDIGNSFHMYETGNIAYFDNDLETREIIKKFTKAEIISFIHSFGKKEEFVRKDAVNCINELKKENIKVDVWVNHTETDYNIGGYSTHGYGDDPDSIFYHTDITIPYGIKFVWLGRVTMIVGQSTQLTPQSFGNIYDYEYKLQSVVNISKELVKSLLSQFGYNKYLMHKNNELVKVVTLKDNQQVYEFMRFDMHWQGVGSGADAQGLAYAISEKNLERLQQAAGYMIVYTHLGKNHGLSQYLPKATVSALRKLAEEYYQGNIYVTTTSRLLNYYINNKHLNWHQDSEGEGTVIKVISVDDPVFGSFIPDIDNLQGITFYVEDSSKTRVFVGNDEVTGLQRNPVDHLGKESVTIPVRRITFPAQYVGGG